MTISAYIELVSKQWFPRLELERFSGLPDAGTKTFVSFHLSLTHSKNYVLYIVLIRFFFKPQHTQGKFSLALTFQVPTDTIRHPFFNSIAHRHFFRYFLLTMAPHNIN